MAVANITGFSVGQDLQTLIIIPENGGAPINSTTLGRLEDFTASPQITELSITPVNNGGVQLTRNIYHGWDGEITFTRYAGALASLMSGIMSQFNNNGLESYYTIAVSVLNSAAGNSPDIYNFQHCVISQIGTGDFGGAKAVTQKLRFRGQQMLPNNASTAISPNG